MTIKQQCEILRRSVCQCGRTKDRGHAFCKPCYYALNPETQRSLYIPVPAFGEAYERALGFLEKCPGSLEPTSPRYVDPRRRRLAAGGI